MVAHSPALAQRRVRFRHIYQMNVMPGKQRGFIGASLLKAQFERSAYGCRLYCCWCAQDIAANKFWEAMGFVPLAFRAGSEKKSNDAARDAAKPLAAPSADFEARLKAMGYDDR